MDNDVLLNIIATKTPKDVKSLKDLLRKKKVLKYAIRNSHGGEPLNKNLPKARRRLYKIKKNMQKNSTISATEANLYNELSKAKGKAKKEHTENVNSWASSFKEARARKELLADFKAGDDIEAKAAKKGRELTIDEKRKVMVKTKKKHLVPMKAEDMFTTHETRAEMNEDLFGRFLNNIKDYKRIRRTETPNIMAGGRRNARKREYYKQKIVERNIDKYNTKVDKWRKKGKTTSKTPTGSRPATKRKRSTSNTPPQKRRKL